MANNMFGPNAGQPFMPSNNYPANQYGAPMQPPQFNQNGNNFRQNGWAPSPQMTQNQPIQRTLAGRVINSIEEVYPNDVPNDGTIAIFPTSNMQAIYARCISRDGLIHTIKFVPEQAPEQANSATTSTSYEQKWEDLNRRLTKIEQRLIPATGSGEEANSNNV